MHLAIETVGVKHSGGAVVLLDVLSAAIASTAVSSVTVFCSPRSARSFALPASPKVRAVELTAAEFKPADRVRWLTGGLARQVTELGPDVLLCMNGIGVSSVPTAVFVQQSLPLCREALRVCDLSTRLRMAVIKALMRRSCRRAALVIAQTATMAEWIQKGFGVPSPRVAVINPWGSGCGMQSEDVGNPDMMEQTPPHLRLLYVGNSSSYKNLACLTEAMPLVRQQLPGCTLFLSCAADHPLCRNEGVVGLGYLGGESLKSAYRHATLLVTASLVESGNLTLVEAMATGTPILAADRPYARDLCGDAAAYFDPLNPAALADSIVELLRDPETRADMARRGAEIAAAGCRSEPYKQLIDRLAALAVTAETQGAARAS